jgi:hypothetical protein
LIIVVVWVNLPDGTITSPHPSGKLEIAAFIWAPISGPGKDAAFTTPFMESAVLEI